MSLLKNKLILWYSLTSVVIILTIGVILNTNLYKVFRQYAIEQRNQQIEKITQQINEQYDQETGQYSVEGLNIIGSAALQNGIIIHVKSRTRGIDWDIKLHKPSECQNVLQQRQKIMEEQSYNFHGGYEEEQIELKNNGNTVGILTAGYYGPYTFEKNEILLLKTLNVMILILGVIFLAVWIIVGTVITKAVNQMSLALKKEEQQKKQITADVAHELRTPLCNLQSHMEAMIDGIWEPTKERLLSCHTEILRLNKIVDQLRELHLIENDENYLFKENFMFSSLCSEIFNDFSIKAKEKEISLVMKMPKDSVIYADRNRLKQCMVNLISNGVWYTPRHGTIEVRLVKKAQEAVITVTDTGAGIEKEELEHIFERFYRTDKSRDVRTGGMGLGLSITKAIIEAHEGSIAVKSQVGKGTEFIITLKG